jgi:hypothetical protein
MSIEAIKRWHAALEYAAACVQNNYCPDQGGHEWDVEIEEMRQAIDQASKQERYRPAFEQVADDLRVEIAELQDKNRLLEKQLEQASKQAAVACTECKRKDALMEMSLATIQSLQPEQEPVYLVWMKAHCAWMHTDRGGFDRYPDDERWMLYTSPPQRQPMTDEQIQTIAFEAVKDNWDWLRFARAIEAAHGITGEKE